MAWYDEILEAADPYLPGRSGPGAGNWLRIKGQPISTLTDAELLAKYDFEQLAEGPGKIDYGSDTFGPARVSWGTPSEPFDSRPTSFTPPKVAEKIQQEGPDAKFSLSDFVQPYYGDNYQEELASARQYFESNFPKTADGQKRKEDLKHFELDSSAPLDRIDDKFEMTDKDAGWSGFGLGLAGGRSSPGRKADSSMYLKWGDGQELLQINSQPSTHPNSEYEPMYPYAEAIAPDRLYHARDSYDSETQRLDTIDRISQSIEHEIGHGAYHGMTGEPNVQDPPRSKIPGKKARSENFDNFQAWGSHIADDREFSNGLGRLQRETAKLTGSRITDKKSLDELLDSIRVRSTSKRPAEPANSESVLKYSPDVRRTLDLLWRAKNGYLGENSKSLYEDAIKILPSFVSRPPEPRFQDYLDYWTAQQRPVAS